MKSAEVFLLAALLLAGCTPPTADTQPAQQAATTPMQRPQAKAQANAQAEASAPAMGGSWTLQAGDLQIDVDAPAQVEADELASISVTYTNVGTGPLEMLDPFHCRVVHGVVDAATGQKPEPTQIYACTSDVPPTIRLNPNEEHAGHVSPVIAGFPAGEYLLPAGWLGEMRQYGAAGDEPQEYTAYPLTLTPPEVRFEIR